MVFAVSGPGASLVRMTGVEGSVFPRAARLSRSRRTNQTTRVTMSARPSTPPTTPPTMVLSRGSEELLVAEVAAAGLDTVWLVLVCAEEVLRLVLADVGMERVLEDTGRLCSVPLIANLAAVSLNLSPDFTSKYAHAGT